MMNKKTTEYLAMVREKTGFSDYKIAEKYQKTEQEIKLLRKE